MPLSFYPDDEWLIDSPVFVLFVIPVLLIAVMSWRWPLLGQILLMVTIQSFICSEAKGQLEGHEVSLNNRFLEVICVFPFGDLVGKKKKTEANLNSITFWMISIWGAPENSHKSDSLEISEDSQRLYSVAGKRRNNKQMFQQRGAHSGKLFLAIQWEGLGGKLVQNKDERAWLSCFQAGTCLKIDFETLDFQAPTVISDRYSH